MPTYIRSIEREWQALEKKGQEKKKIGLFYATIDPGLLSAQYEAYRWRHPTAVFSLFL